MVTRTGFEPVNAAVKGRCVKPLHQRAIDVLLYISINLKRTQQHFFFLIKFRYLQGTDVLQDTLRNKPGQYPCRNTSQ